MGADCRLADIEFYLCCRKSTRLNNLREDPQLSDVTFAEIAQHGFAFPVFFRCQAILSGFRWQRR
jgi:hypothetical protein